jgi:hypothetical protein
MSLSKLVLFMIAYASATPSLHHGKRTISTEAYACPEGLNFKCCSKLVTVPILEGTCTQSGVVLNNPCRVGMTAGVCESSNFLGVCCYLPGRIKLPVCITYNSYNVVIALSLLGAGNYPLLLAGCSSFDDLQGYGSSPCRSRVSQFAAMRNHAKENSMGLR